jgi:SAM-dependent methyltransferase
VVFGSDWRAEYQFLQQCFDQHAQRKVKRIFEPACGTGRLLIQFAAAGYQVSGLDLNERAVDYCNQRFKRRGLQPTAFVGDMADFSLKRPVDAAFNMINSFRHLPNEKAAEGHLRSVAAALSPGGLYMLGLHLTPANGVPGDEESWSARRGHLAVVSRLWSMEVDLRRRQERVGMTFDVYTPTKQFRLSEELNFRTYTAAQFTKLLATVPELETVATYDFGYEIERPIEINRHTQDAVFVLRKRK